MDLAALLERYQTLLPWSLARTKCFVSMILGMISSGSVQQHKTALGFIGAAKLRFLSLFIVLARRLLKNGQPLCKIGH